MSVPSKAIIVRMDRDGFLTVDRGPVLHIRDVRYPVRQDAYPLELMDAAQENAGEDRSLDPADYQKESLRPVVFEVDARASLIDFAHLQSVFVGLNPDPPPRTRLRYTRTYISVRGKGGDGVIPLCQFTGWSKPFGRHSSFPQAYCWGERRIPKKDVGLGGNIKMTIAPRNNGPVVLWMEMHGYWGFPIYDLADRMHPLDRFQAYHGDLKAMPSANFLGFGASERTLDGLAPVVVLTERWRQVKPNTPIMLGDTIRFPQIHEIDIGIFARDDEREVPVQFLVDAVEKFRAAGARSVILTTHGPSD